MSQIESLTTQLFTRPGNKHIRGYMTKLEAFNCGISQSSHLLPSFLPDKRHIRDYMTKSKTSNYCIKRSEFTRHSNKHTKKAYQKAI